MSRRFQFSLRALLVVVTLSCVSLALPIERARMRGQAIEAVIAEHHYVAYRDGSSTIWLRAPDENHFWSDLKQVLVFVQLFWSPVDAKTGVALARINKLVRLDCAFCETEEDFKRLEKLSDGCEIAVWHELSLDLRRRLQQRFPKCKIVNGYRGPSA